MTSHHDPLSLCLPPVAGELLRLPVGGGLPGVPEGHAVGQHPAEPADLRPGGLQVPRAALHAVPHRAL